ALNAMRAGEKARKTARPEKLAVVGFTSGLILTWPGAGKPAGELGQLTDYPIVSVTNRTFNEPYNLLASPSGIVIDSKGVLRAFYLHPMKEQEIADVATLADWDKPVRPPPLEDPWLGKSAPKPVRQLIRAWS